MWYVINLAQYPEDSSSVQFSRSVMSDSLWLYEPQHTRPPCPSPTPRVHSDSHPSSQWCHPTISSSIIPFSSCPQSLSASGSFQNSQLFASGGQSIRVSALASVLPMNIQDWFPLGLTIWLSLQSKGLSRVFSNTTVQKHQFFGAQLSQHQGLFQWVGSSHQVAKYWSFSFSISPSSGYSGLISFRIDWFDLLAVQGTLKSLLQPHNSKASILRCSAFFITLTFIHTYWKNHSFD